jgi:hypothetical protein
MTVISRQRQRNHEDVMNAVKVAPNTSARSGFVYVIHSSSGLYKIGHTTKDPNSRLHALRTATADDLTLVGVIPGTARQERELHAMLAAWHVAREWFRPCRAIERLCEQVSPVAPRGPNLRRLSPVEPTFVGDVLKRLGKPSEAARALGISNPSVILNWRKRNSVPVEHVAAVSRLTGIPPQQLRPDLARIGAAA